jgi:hypothetical protein
LAQIIPERRGFEFVQMKRERLYPRGDNSKSFKNLLPHNQPVKINQTWYKLTFDKGNSSLFK